MAAVTPAKWAKAVAVVETGLLDAIEQANATANDYRCLVLALRRLPTPGKAQRPTSEPSAPTGKPNGKRPQAGTLPARILDIIGELDADWVTLGQIMAAKPGAKPNAVRYQLQLLVRAGWVIAEGATSQRKYALPAKKGGK